MVNATNVDAHAVNTIRWLSAPETTIVVPVYQRQYRWDIGGCEQLLSDIRAVADSDSRNTHFLASILSTASNDADSELVLIDGQQRITTLMLLIAALSHTIKDSDPELAAELADVLVRANDSRRTKLRPHRAWAQIFESVVLDERDPAVVHDSRFDANYAYFRSQVRLEEVPRIWKGLQKLEHVAITLAADANAQQIFESLNSTGEPLRDHELIHNYVLMGLSHAEQTEIENTFWLPIEENTGELIAHFWRHYLVMTTGREVATTGERGVYDAFRQQFPRLDLASLRDHATAWREYSEAYRILINPAEAPNETVGAQLRFVNTFGRGMYPLVMRSYFDYSHGVISEETLVQNLEHIQSLLLRRTVAGLKNDRLVARLCRARAESAEGLVLAIARITPSNERVRIALKYSELPHAAYVLGRLQGVTNVHELDVEHIFPLAPGDSWSGDGVRAWADYTDDEQNSHFALSKTLGNLTLLEQDLAERVFIDSYPVKRAAYAKSAVTSTRELAETASWGTSAIAARTVALADQFLELWARPAVVLIDDDELTPILDAIRRRGWPRGWEREFEYVEYRGEHWEVYDIRYLFNRIFKRLWADARPAVESFSAKRGGPIYEAKSWNGEWDQLDENTYLYMGWDSKYMLTAVQGVLDEAGISSEVFVKYSYIGVLM